MTDSQDAMLVVERGVYDSSVIPLDQPSSMLGKFPSSTIVLDNPYISRRQTGIFRCGADYEIEDLGSKNGTSVNGSQVAGRRRLNFGDRIDLGWGQVVLRFQRLGSTLTLPPNGVSPPEGLVVDVRSRDVWVRGQKVEPPLSRKEFDVLALLYLRRGEACSKDEIAVRGWPVRRMGDVADQDIEQYVRRLRLRIEPHPSRPQHIITVRGFGYRLSGP
jgi:hypothetical protein